jgi:hypothetical protein
VIDEVLGILRSPEIVLNVEKIAENKADKYGGNAPGPEITKQNLIMALKNLTEVWTFLYPTEQQKVVSMLTDEVTMGDDGIRITMNLEGFDTVMKELGAM